MEDLFVGANPRNVLTVGQARGAVLAACGLAGLEASAYPPAEVKAAVCGYGRADKSQVQRMVRRHAARPTWPASATMPPTRWRWPSATPCAAVAGGWSQAAAR